MSGDAKPRRRRRAEREGQKREIEARYAELIEQWSGARVRRGEIALITHSGLRCNLLMFGRAVRVEPEALTRKDVEHWLEVSEMAPATARMRLSQVRLFCRWLAEEGIVARDPTFGVKGPREPRRLPRGLTAEAVDRTIDAAPDSRARLCILLMVQEGLRRKEVAGLQIGDIDLGERTLRIRGKGGHERLLPISSETWGP